MAATRSGRKLPSIRTLWAIAKSPELRLSDEDLHGVVYRETGKESMINQEQTCEEHLQILDAALAGDWDGAAMALQHHLELARDKAEGVIKVIRLW